MTAFRIVLSSLAAALRSPGVILLAWLVVTVPALLVAGPVAAELGASLDHHPAAGPGTDLALDVDFARTHPELALSLGGAGLFVVLAWTLLTGSILTAVGTGRRVGWSAFLAEGARLFPRNLRAVVLGVVPALLLVWGIGALDGWLREGPLADADPGMISLLGFGIVSLQLLLEALSWLWGLLFVGLLFTSKIARARLSVLDRKSAFLAWGRAIGSVLRRPFRALLVVGTFSGLLVLVSWLLGLWIARLDQGDLIAGLVGGQLFVLATQVWLVAVTVAARRFLFAEQIAREGVEPTVLLPRREPAPAEKRRPETAPVQA